MNNVIFSGRLTADPEVKLSKGGKNISYARYSIAVDRTFKKQGEANVDFFNCVAFGKNAEFVEKFLNKGIKIIVRGRMQSGSYMNKDSVKIPTVTLVVEEHEFGESKKNNEEVPAMSEEEFNNIEVSAELPFK